AVGLDFFQGGGFAEAGDVLVRSGFAVFLDWIPAFAGMTGRVFAGMTRYLFAAPGVVGVGDSGDVFGGQFAVGAVGEAAQLARVDEQGLAGAGAETLTRPSATLSQRERV